MIQRIPRSPRGQAGATLAVVLILLVVLLLLSLASIRGTLLEQYMSTSQLDRSLSFQAAEAALREGEAFAASKPTAPAANTCQGSSTGLCGTPTAGIQRWIDANADGVADTALTSWNAISRAATASVGANTATPRYIVEVMAVDAIPGSNCTTSGDLSPDAACTSWESRYRVTARSANANRADVILQSNLAVP
jgi:type IV pilus assembly protein PilX